ncbi:MAG: Ig-like domain-containing protein, partial [Lachnospiraceae bacterium]|nr:Ig-like domain-containing protein [Lachnospiraceae bacterium]
MKKKRGLSILLILALMFGCLMMPSLEGEAATKIALSSTKVALYAGESQTITLKQNGKAIKSGVTWKTSKKTVATVSKGKIMAKGKGTANITARYKNKNYVCKVTVTALNLTLSSKTLSMIAGDTKTLTLKNNGKKVTAANATWKSSKPAFVSVANGKITALKKGSAKITATFHKKSVSCSVTVAALNIALSKKTVNLTIGQSESITLTRNGKNITSSATWSSSNPGVATVVNGKITTQMYTGSATITARYNNTSYTCAV